MQYLTIRNPGVADYRGFTLLGVSTTRNSGLAGTIGQFGSGSKLSIALLLRHNINPVIVCGNLKLEFFVKEEHVKGQVFRRVCVKYSGRDVDGTTKNSTEDLGFTLEWGVQDWKMLSMAFREFVSNAIDGSICAGGSHRGVQFEFADKPRAKYGYTQVYIPYTDEINSIFNQLGFMFLHFGAPDLLERRCLPKRKPEENKIYIYKKGVLVSYLNGKSVFDYNLGDELTLDESRNAQEWDVKYSIARSLRNESPQSLAKIFKSIIEDPTVWEAKLDQSYLQNDSYAKPEVQEKRKQAMKEAWESVTGPNSVITSSKLALASFIERKGYKPIALEGGWAKALESYDILSDSKVLSKNELDGKIVGEPTKEMLDCTQRVWALIEKFNLTNGKTIPGVKSFTSIMDGGCSTMGYYLPGGNDIYLHSSLGAGKEMFKTCLEEVVHYVTGSTDGSRDLQQFLFDLITDMAAG